jgi:glycosyltransferase involved in cell wall biosynthesis
MVILIIGGLPRSLVHFRGTLLKALVGRGLKVFAAADGWDEEVAAELREWGVLYCPIRMARAGINPLTDMKTLWDVIRLVRQVKPDAILSYTIKPVIYAGLAARFCGVERVFSMIEGLGRAFMPHESFSHMLSSFVAKGLYRIGLLGSKRVFFLNPDDLNQFVKEGYITIQKTVLLNGIGIDLAYYPSEQLPDYSCFRFLMIARLLKDKGVREYIEAARIIRQRYGNVECVLAGDLDENPSSIKQAELEAWRRDGIVRHVGYIKDVRPVIRDCHVFVLPSFREGTPRTVLEAMATGRAIITTDVPGCRETVRGKDECEVQKSEAIDQQSWMRGQGGSSQWSEVGGQQPTANNLKRTPMKIGRNGILVPPKDVDSLVKAMEFFVRNRDQIAVMGRESRRYAEERYDVHKVNAEMMKAMGLL